MAERSRPLASAGLDGATTFSPAMWVKSDSRLPECWAAEDRRIPSEARSTSGTLICPPDM